MGINFPPCFYVFLVLNDSYRKKNLAILAKMCDIWEGCLLFFSETRTPKNWLPSSFFFLLFGKRIPCLNKETMWVNHVKTCIYTWVPETMWFTFLKGLNVIHKTLHLYLLGPKLLPRNYPTGRFACWNMRLGERQSWEFSGIFCGWVKGHGLLGGWAPS